jgi:hypothetical protein
VIKGIKDMFTDFGAVDGNAFGVDYWNPGSEEPAWVLQIGDTEGTHGLLHDARDCAEHALTNAGTMMLPPQHTPWVPHICLAYSTDPSLLNEVGSRVGPVTFDRARVAFGGQVTDVPMGGPPHD